MGFVSSQEVPVDLNHPVNQYILRYHTRGSVTSIHPGLRPFTLSQIIKALDEISNLDMDIDERSILQVYLKEFDIRTLRAGISGPWQSAQLKNALESALLLYEPDREELRFLSYKDEGLVVWVGWNETFSIDIEDTIQRSFQKDQVTFSGQFYDNLSFYSRYSLYRVGHQDGYPIPNEFKQGFILYEDKNLNWLVWDHSAASLKWINNILDLELSKIPIYWGVSMQDSPILSANVEPFTFFRASKHYKRIRTQSLIGSLVPYKDSWKSTIEEKHIAAHRFEFDALQNLTLAFSEMVIYSRRTIELGYLLPVNLFWSEEHGLGDQDNVLMSVDVFWNVRPGLFVYGTFFWDELNWFELFNPWWGNKFIFQPGFYWVPFTNPKLPDFRVEWTISRPWVYTHKDSLLTYTSATHSLGFPIGPNAQLVRVEMNMWPMNTFFLSMYISSLTQGSGPGSDPNDDYSVRDRALDNKTSTLMGDIMTELIVGAKLHYRVTELFGLTGNISFASEQEKFTGRFGLFMNY